MSGRGNHVGRNALLLSLAAAMGAGAALLFTPRSGERTRKDLARAAKKARRRVEDLSGSIAEVVDAVEDTAGDLMKRGNRIARKARKELRTVIKEGRDRISRFAA